MLLLVPFAFVFVLFCFLTKKNIRSLESYSIYFDIYIAKVQIPQEAYPSTAEKDETKRHEGL